MAFGGFNEGTGAAPMTEINMVPLIDVALVLLMILIITAPLLTHAVKVDLPEASSTPNVTRTGHVAISIDASGGVFWNGERTDRGALRARLVTASRTKPQPELHLRADKATAYQAVAEVIADSARAGIVRIGFVSNPENR